MMARLMNHFIEKKRTLYHTHGHSEIPEVPLHAFQGLMELMLSFSIYRGGDRYAT